MTMRAASHAGSASASAEDDGREQQPDAVEGQDAGDAELGDAHDPVLDLLLRLGLGQPQLVAHELARLVGEAGEQLGGARLRALVWRSRIDVCHALDAMSAPAHRAHPLW